MKIEIDQKTTKSHLACSHNKVTKEVPKLYMFLSILQFHKRCMKIKEDETCKSVGQKLDKQLPHVDHT